jgi:lysozyme
MKLHPRVTASAVELVKRFEGLRREPARLASGGWTVGYGHTRFAREGKAVTADEAEALLYYDLSVLADRLDAWIFTPLTQNQFEAILAFAFNIGLENFRTSAVLRRLNAGDLLQAASALELWRRADFGGEDLVVDALVRRRAAEKAHFLTPAEGFRPSPSPVLRPRLDGGGLIGSPFPPPPEPSFGSDIFTEAGIRPFAPGPEGREHEVGQDCPFGALDPLPPQAVAAGGAVPETEPPAPPVESAELPSQFSHGPGSRTNGGLAATLTRPAPGGRRLRLLSVLAALIGLVLAAAACVKILTSNPSPAELMAGLLGILLFVAGGARVILGLITPSEGR